MVNLLKSTHVILLTFHCIEFHQGIYNKCNNKIERRNDLTEKFYMDVLNNGKSCTYKVTTGRSLSLQNKVNIISNFCTPEVCIGPSQAGPEAVCARA